MVIKENFNISSTLTKNLSQENEINAKETYLLIDVCRILTALWVNMELEHILRGKPFDMTANKRDQ